MLTLSCPACGFTREIPVSLIPAGSKRVACPKCSRKFPLPTTVSESPLSSASLPSAEPARFPDNPPLTPTEIRLICPHCNAKRSVPLEKVPQRVARVTCPQCRKSFAFQGDRVRARQTLVRPEQHPVLAMSSAVAEPEPEVAEREVLSGIGELFAKSWRTFVRRLPALIAISLLVLVLAGLGYLLLIKLTSQAAGVRGGWHGPARLAVTAVMTLYTMLVLSWTGAAATYAIVDQELGAWQALAYGLQRIGSFLWVLLLSWFIVTGGYLLFFVPGLLFTLWFIFAAFVLAREDTRGMEALLKSRAYVSGFGRAVLGRIVLGAVIVGMISAVSVFLPVLGGLACLPLGFFLLAFYAELFQELTEIKRTLSFDCSRGVKTRWLLAGGAGFIFALGLALVIGGLG